MVVLPTCYFKYAFRNGPRLPWDRVGRRPVCFVVEKTPATTTRGTRVGRTRRFRTDFLAKRGMKKTGEKNGMKKQVLYTRRTPRRVRTGVNNRVRSADRFPSILHHEMFQCLAARSAVCRANGVRTSPSSADFSPKPTRKGPCCRVVDVVSIRFKRTPTDRVGVSAGRLRPIRGVLRPNTDDISI